MHSIDVAYRYSAMVSLSVCVYVHLCARHTREPCKSDWTIEMPFVGGADLCRAKEPYIRWGAHWCFLANMMRWRGCGLLLLQQLSYDQLWATFLTGRNAITWHSSLLNDEHVGGRPCITAMMHGHMTVHHCKLASLISINVWCVTTVLIITKKATVIKSQNVKDRSQRNKYLIKIKEILEV